MPISAGTPIIQNQFSSALSMKQGSSTSTTASMLSSAIASIAPMGILMAGPVTVPLTAPGVSAGNQMIKGALSMDKAAKISTTAKLIASGISVIAPLAPPAGLQLLSQQIESALSFGQGASISTTASMVASAITTYYMTGGVL